MTIATAQCGEKIVALCDMYLCICKLATAGPMPTLTTGGHIQAEKTVMEVIQSKGESEANFFQFVRTA